MFLLQVIPSWKETLFLMPELQLTLFACFILVLDILLPRGKKTLTAYTSLIGLAFTLLGLLQVYYSTRSITPVLVFYQMYVIDNFALIFKAIVLIAALISVAISIKYLETEKELRGDYYSLLLFATVGMMFMASSYNFIMFYVSLELMAISIYVLVGYFKHNDKSNEASLKYFLLGAFSSGIFLYGISLVYAITGELNLLEVAIKISLFIFGAETSVAGGAHYLLAFAISLIGAGLLFKVAATPFHMWAPDAYEGAPTSVTAFMSVGVKAASYAMLARIFLVAFPALRTIKELPGWLPMLIVIAALTMTIGNVAAMTQKNTKRMLAYSSISQAGYILLGLIASNELGYTGLVFYILAYTIMNLGAFAVIILLRRDNIKGDRLEHLNGLVKKRPVLAIMMLIFLLSLAGIPPTSGFIGKYLLFASLIKADNIWLNRLAVLAVLNTVISFYYYAQIIKAMFIELPSDDKPVKLNTSSTVSLVFMTVLTIFIGIYPEPFIQVSKSVAKNLAPAQNQDPKPKATPKRDDGIDPTIDPRLFQNLSPEP
jgi:NADH-quinone oxidoreductase subunit N